MGAKLTINGFLVTKIRAMQLPYLLLLTLVENDLEVFHLASY